MCMYNLQKTTKPKNESKKKIHNLPAATSLISQTRKPSFCPPKAYTKGRSGQQDAQNSIPYKKIILS